MLNNHPSYGIKIPGIFEGQVVKHDTSMYMGVKIWVPGLHTEDYLTDEKSIDKLPTARAVAPLFGNCDGNSGMFTYPAIGTFVYCFSIDGDPNTIVYFAADYEKSANAITSYSYTRIKDGEKNCAWMRQGPAHIILHTPPKIGDAPTTESRSKVIEIYSGGDPGDTDSGNKSVASICIFSNNDVEIKGANISISASKSIDFTVKDTSVGGTQGNKLLEGLASSVASGLSKLDDTMQVTLAADRVTVKALNINIYSKMVNVVSAILKKMCFDQLYYTLRRVIGIKSAIKTDQIESTSPSK